jgi:hypothetical protein
MWSRDGYTMRLRALRYAVTSIHSTLATAKPEAEPGGARVSRALAEFSGMSPGSCRSWMVTHAGGI